LPEHRLDDLVERCAGLRPLLTGVVHPCSTGALLGRVEASTDGLIEPVLFGPAEDLADLDRFAEQASVDFLCHRVVVTLDADDSAAKGAGAGEAQPLMKDSLHSEVLF